MKRTTLNLTLSFALLVAMLALSACVRPAPGSANPADNPSPTPNIFFEATIPPLATPVTGSASPTPDSAALPTPLPEQPVGDAAATPPSETAPEAQPPADAGQAQPTAAPVTNTAGEIVHIVQPGDNLFRIGLRYGFTAQELATYNGIPNVNIIYVGQEIRIPPK